MAWSLLILGLLHTSTASASTFEDELRAFEPLRAHRGTHEAPTIPPSAYERVELGKPVSGLITVEGVAAAKGWGLALYPLPVEAVWAALNDEQQHPGVVPVDVSDVIRGEAHHNGRYVFQYMKMPIVADRWWIVEQHHNAALFSESNGGAWELYWEDRTDPATLEGTKYAHYREQGQAVEWTTGSWLLLPIGEHQTLVEYFVWTDPGGKLPPALASRFAGGAIKDTLRSIETLGKRYDTASHEGFVRPDRTPL